MHLLLHELLSHQLKKCDSRNANPHPPHRGLVDVTLFDRDIEHQHHSSARTDCM